MNNTFFKTGRHFGHSRLLLTFLVCLFSSHALAQKLSVGSLQRVDQIIAADDRIMDYNNEPCALVKIQGAEIDSISGAFKVTHRGTETWAYVTKGRYRLTLFKRGHEEQLVDFRKYDIDGVEGNRIYKLVVSAPTTETANTNNERRDEPERTSVIESEWRYSDTEYRRHRSEYVGYEPIFFSFGIRAGLNLATTHFESPYDGAGMTTGFHLGVNADIRLTDGFYLAPALLYSGKGYKYDKNNFDEKCSASYITVPLHLSPRFAVGEGAELQLFAGPYLAFAIGGTIDSKNKGEMKFTEYYDAFDYGVSLGAGALFSEHYYVGATYELGFAKYRNRNICISLGYNF